MSEIEKHDTTKPERARPAPGKPGLEPSWNTGAKTAVGTALAPESRIWFTLSHGYLNELYFPDVDHANTRCVRFLVAGEDFVSNEDDGMHHSVSAESPGVPAFHVSSRCRFDRFVLEKDI